MPIPFGTLHGVSSVLCVYLYFEPYLLCSTLIRLNSPHLWSALQITSNLGGIRGWGTLGEPLTASQAAAWAEHACTEWGSVFQHALKQRTDFSNSPEALPFPRLVPEFNCFIDGKVNRGTLRASGVLEWEVRTSIAGLVTANATTFSECILAISNPVRA
jgi:hypothetical protein